jgi:hypothetical protein
MKLVKNKLTCTVVFLSLLSVGCGVGVSQDQSTGVLQDLPMMEIIQRVAPAHDRVGNLTVPASSSSSKEEGRLIRHDEYSVDIGLKPNAVPGFAGRLCDQLKEALAARGRIRGGGESGPDGCSFHLVNQGVHAWVTVSPLLERGDRYWASVIVDEW